MSANSNLCPPSPDHVDLGAVVRAVVRKVPLLLVLAGLAGAATAGVLATMAPKYLSQAQLEVRGAGSPETGGRPDKEAVGTHVRSLMSTELALKMSKALKLTEDPDFNSRLEPNDLYGRLWRKVGIGGPKIGETDEDRLLQAYFKAVRAYQVRETRSIIVDCTTSSAKFSADCANTLAELYRDSLSGRVVSESSDVRAKLAPQVDRLTRETAEAEALAAEFRGKANLFQGGAQLTQLKDQQLSELTAELTRVAAQRSEAEARANAAREMSARGIAAANPDVQKSALVPKMEEQRVALERQISELSATLLRGHPRMKQLTSELAGLQLQIKAEVAKVVESLGNDAKIAAEREAGIRRRIDEMKKNVVTSAPDTARLAQLDNQAKAKRAELERLQRQYETAASNAGASVSTPEIEIVSRAYPSNEKIFPKIGSMASLAAFAMLILSLALTLTRELMRGARPAVTSESTRRMPAPTSAPVSEPVLQPLPTSRSVSDLVAQLTALAQDSRGFRVLVASDASGGRSESDASEVARAIAAAGKRVALVGWAGSGDELSLVTGVENSVGTVQLLAGQASLEDAIQTVDNSGLAIIAAGAGEAAPIDGDSANMLLDALDELYDFIVVCASSTIAAALFAAVQGRFDAGIIVLKSVNQGTRREPAAFLGFDVPDFPILEMAPIAPARSAVRGRTRAINRAGEKTSAHA